MAFASGSSHGLRYIKEENFGVTPENPTMRALRHTSCSLVLGKDSFQSNELRKDAQISDFRHGNKKASGEIGVELSYGEFDDFLAAAVRGSWEENLLKAGTALPTFTFEREFADIRSYQKFTGCAVNSLSLEIKNNEMVTGTINIVGKGVAFGSAPFAADEIPSLTNSPLDGFSGILKEGGSAVAVITSISLQIENNIEAANVIGSDEAAALVPKRINCTGTVSAFFENMSLLNKFVQEIESELEVTLGNGGPGSYIIKLPRIKYSGGSNPSDGEGPIMLNMPFQALLDECTGTNIIIERVPTESVVAEPCVLTYSGTDFTETPNNTGTFDSVLTVNLSGGAGKTFTGQNGIELPGVSFSGIPEGLTASAVRVSDTSAEIRLAGAAASHTVADSQTASVTFKAAAFTKGFCKCEGDSVQNGTQSLTITFIDVEAAE